MYGMFGSKESLLREPSFLKFTSHSDASLTKRCGRTVNKSRHERLRPELRCWWTELCKTLEEDITIPPDRRKSVLEMIYPKWILPKILQILSRDNSAFKKELNQIPLDTLSQSYKEIKVNSNDTDKRVSNRSVWDVEDLKENQEVMKMNLKKPACSWHTAYVKPSTSVPKSVMYNNFFKRKTHRAAVWRKLPPLYLEEMNLNQKAEAITEKIATDFIEWLRDLGGYEELLLSVEAVIAMFEIGFHNSSAASLNVNVKETPSVPKKVAMAMNMPNLARRRFLHQEIKTDIIASKKKVAYSAFGTQLPTDMRGRPPTESHKRWISCDQVPEDLASMATVWQGITHLKSTRAYCEFLLKERPEMEPPKYLLDCGMLNIKNLDDKPNISGDYYFDDISRL